MTMLRLHIGAHKTATTYLQGLLDANQGRIARSDQSYWLNTQTRPPVAELLAEPAGRRVAKTLTKRMIRSVSPRRGRARYSDLPLDSVL